jgi:hypothetical protein
MSEMIRLAGKGKTANRVESKALISIMAKAPKTSISIWKKR